MNDRQLRMYYGYWNASKKALQKAGKTVAETEIIRKKIHFQRGAFSIINGTVKVRSSKHLTNGQIDQILADFRALSHGDDLMFQLEKLNQPERRILYATAKLLDKILIDDNGYPITSEDHRKSYLEGIIKKPLAETNDRDLQVCIMACTRTAKYKKSPKKTENNPF